MLLSQAAAVFGDARNECGKKFVLWVRYRIITHARVHRIWSLFCVLDVTEIVPVPFMRTYPFNVRSCGAFVQHHACPSLRLVDQIDAAGMTVGNQTAADREQRKRLEERPNTVSSNPTGSYEIAHNIASTGAKPQGSAEST